jgi:hypothetical protein
MALNNTINDLPNELLTHIISFLDVPGPSISHLHDQPSSDLLCLDSRRTCLKNTSLVSKLWRVVSVPLLFRHLVWRLDAWDLAKLYKGLQMDVQPPPLQFLLDRNLGRERVDTFAVVFDDLDERKGSYSHIMVRFESLDLHRPHDAYAHCRNYDWFWESIFAVVDPLRFTVIGSPRMLATLLKTSIYLCDEWSFSTGDHLLSLSRPDRSIPPTCAGPDLSPHYGSTSTSPPSVLFTCRPWTGVLLNEGSHMRVYKTYEYFTKQPPSILPALLGAEPYPDLDDLDILSNDPLLGPYVREFSYVAMFPLSSHVRTLVEHLPRRLDRLFVQLVPRNRILEDPQEMQNIDQQDLWTERNRAYVLLMRELFKPSRGGRWTDLKMFESGDSADRVGLPLLFYCLHSSFLFFPWVTAPLGQRR